MQNEQLRQDVVDYQKQIDSQKDTILLRRGEDSDYRSQLSKKNFELVQYLDEIQVKSARCSICVRLLRTIVFFTKLCQFLDQVMWSKGIWKTVGFWDALVWFNPNWQLGQRSCSLTSTTTLPKWDGGENQKGKKPSWVAIRTV